MQRRIKGEGECGKYLSDLVSSLLALLKVKWSRELIFSPMVFCSSLSNEVLHQLLCRPNVSRSVLHHADRNEHCCSSYDNLCHQSAPSNQQLESRSKLGKLFHKEYGTLLVCGYRLQGGPKK